MMQTDLAVINNTLQIVESTNTIPDARKLIALAQGYVETARKLYNAASITSINELTEDKDKSFIIAKKAGELKLYAEARLGELIKIEQDAGRLAVQGHNQHSLGSRSDATTTKVKTLADYGLTKDDSHRAQELAEHKDVIAKVIVDSLDIPTRAAVVKAIQSAEKISTTNNKLVIPHELPKSKYRTIVIDPPWPIQKIVRDVRPNQIEIDYPTMTIEEIQSFPISNFASLDGCHIYLWTTHKYLPLAFQTLEKWGVNYECCLTWVKNVGFTPFSWMYSTEFCLFGRFGSLPLMKLGRRTDFQAKVKQHSRKPDEFYHIVCEVSPEPRLDIFSREKHEGFSQYGNEVNKFQ
jgi:N6-adenosine-specific RNA methylase IME4